jgi:hypothetical protein
MPTEPSRSIAASAALILPTIGTSFIFVSVAAMATLELYALENAT